MMQEIMGFVWPMMAASAEGMMWFWLIVILLIIGRGKILPSEKSVIIERTGQYKMHLAPGLNLAQPLVEAIANKVPLREVASQNDLLFRFEVRDKNVASRKHPFYLLEVSSLNGHLSFEARPAPQEPVLPNTQPHEYSGQTIMDEVENAIHSVAKLLGIALNRVN
jgi:hypothetical protein